MFLHHILRRGGRRHVTTLATKLFRSSSSSGIVSKPRLFSRTYDTRLISSTTPTYSIDTTDDGDSFSSLRLPDNTKEIHKILLTIAKARRETASGTFVPKDFLQRMCDWYDRRTLSERKEFAKILASLDVPDTTTLSDQLERYKSLTAKRKQEERNLRDALIPYHEDVLQLIVALLPNGMKWVIDLRADVLRHLKDSNDTLLRYLDGNIKAMLKNWFGGGFLKLVRVTWENSPGHLLEKIVAYEKVHPTRRISDLKTRLGSGRRCFAFVHPTLPEEPLVFVHVALVPEIASSLRYIIDKTSSEDCEDYARAAIFWSISNTQLGLQGVDLGHLLIKRVVERLQRSESSHDDMKFSTLSPIPGFSSWLDMKLEDSEDDDDDDTLFMENEIKILSEILNCSHSSDLFQVLRDREFVSKRLKSDERFRDAIQEPLLRLAAQYIVNEKKRKNQALCPVANFHIRNGAIVWRINFWADRSERGLRQSLGLMVNYKYDLDFLETNHARYISSGGISVDDSVSSLLSSSSTSSSSSPSSSSSSLSYE